MRRRLNIAGPSVEPDAPLDFAELLRRFAEDPTGTAADVHDAFADDVHRTVWHVLGRDPDHDDIVHDAFVRVFRGLHRVREPGRLRSWVSAVALNTARDELRRRKMSSLWAQMVGRTGSDQFEEESRHQARDLVRQIHEILEKFSVDDRVLLVLRHLEERELTEIAELTGRSLSTVNRRLGRANRRFEALVRRHPDLRVWLDGPGEGTS